MPLMPSVKQDAVQEIKDRIDLVDLISEHLRLQKAGRDLKGLCPFHQEKTPSLYVSPEKQLWHCYGCQKGGDHFTFIQDIEHVDFRGALRLLAEKTGVILEESPGAGRQRELKRTISKLNLLAAQYFHHILLENEVLIGENLANLDAVSGQRVRVFAFPLKIRGGDAGHARIVAEV